MDAVRQIADAVLYEGYVLWPYRRSALKNQRRWTFGGVYPEAHSRGRDDDPHVMRTDCLLEGADASIDVRVRFLHVVARRVVRIAGGRREDVDELTVAGERHLGWDEAVEREIVCAGLDAGRLVSGHRAAIAVAAGAEHEALREADGSVAGEIVRSWDPLDGAVDIAAERVAPGLLRIAVRIANTTPFDGGDREAALRRTFCSTHTVLHADRGAFVSLTDPPDALRAVADACRAGNAGTWPVLVGEPGERHTLLSSPIILEDHPRIAPESPGDLFDGGEIDQMLTLYILSLTDEEKAEMRDSDPRAREILERTEALTPEELMRMNGAIREFGMVRER
jgi:hydrogenase maturation protease